MPTFGKMISCALLAATLLAAQMNLASLTGIITDASGAVVPQATVVLRSASTDTVQSTATNGAGVFLLSSLVPGQYKLEISAAGFQSKTLDGIAVGTSDRARLDVTLQVGAQADRVEVVDTAPLLQSETAEVSKGISGKDVINVPVSSTRSAYQFLNLSTGIATKGSSAAPDIAAQASINGARAQGTAFVIDGASTTHIGGIGELVGTPESIQEVKLLGSSYSAEYGRTSGATVIFQVRSGSNQYHGSLFEYNRNSALAAQNWADNARGVKASQLNVNQYGATLGGPVPGLRSKLFFFGSWESQVDRRPANLTRSIPDPALRGGDFSSVNVIVNDPLTRAPFPGNRIPANRLDPAALALLKLLPAPNLPGLATAFGIRTNNYIHIGSGSDPLHTGTGRADYNVTANDKLFFTYSQNTQGPRDQGIDFDNALVSSGGPRTRNIRRATVGYSRILRPNLVNEFLAYAQRDPRVTAPWVPEFDVTKELGIQRRIGSTLPTVSMSSSFGGYGNSTYSNWVHQPAGLSNIATWMKGRHNVRFGAQFLQNQFWFISANTLSGAYSFNGEMTALALTGQNNPVNPLGDLLLGLVKTASAPVPQIPVNRTNVNLGIFLQDDWKVSRRLTLNLGLRQEMETKQHVRNNVYSRLDLASGQLLVAGRNASANLNVANDYLNLSPRVGVAYLLNDRTVVRAGFAIFHANFWVDNGELVSYPGWTASTDWPNRGLGVPQEFRFFQGFPVQQIPAVADPLAQFAAATPALPLPHPAVTYDPNDRLPYALQWNLTVQRQVGAGFLADVGYVATRSVRQARTIPVNQPTLDKAPLLLAGTAIQTLRPYPRVGAFNAVLYDTNAIYHSLQARGTRRFAHGFSLDLNYTFSKNIDNSSRFSDSFQIPWQYPAIERSLSSFDFPHAFSASGIHELPLGRGKRWLSQGRWWNYLVGGFQLNGSIRALSGEPLTIRQNNANPVLSAQRPDVIDASRLDGKLDDPVHSGPALRWLIPTNGAGFPFRASSNTGIGNLGRNTSRGPGFFVTNFSVFKKVPIRERWAAELRFEAFNALNTVNYGEPSVNINDANYGLITGADTARQIQLGLRISF